MRRLIVPIIAAVVLLTGCGTSAAERASQATSARASAQGYPVEVVSCGIPLRLDAPPSKVLVLGETGFSNLAALGLVDRVALRAGVAHFDSAAPDLQATYDAIPAVDAGRGENGAVILSTEVALKAGVDLVIGYDKGVDREALTKAGIKLYSPEAYCPTYAGGKASWHLVEEELTKLATIFGRPQNARRAQIADWCRAWFSGGAVHAGRGHQAARVRGFFHDPADPRGECADKCVRGQHETGLRSLYGGLAGP